MDREIKFDLLWERPKQWYGPYRPADPKYKHTTLVLGQTGFRADTQDICVRAPDGAWVILSYWRQCIDRKDKNGNEIYEGDLVTHPLCVKEPHDENEPCEHFVGRIQYEADRGQYFAVNIKRNGYVIAMTEAYKLEVIGNIYQNPELLKDSA